MYSLSLSLTHTRTDRELLAVQQGKGYRRFFGALGLLGMIICVVFEMLLNTNRDIDAIAAADDFNYVYSISRSEFLDAFLPAFALKFQLRSLELLVALIVSLCSPTSAVPPTNNLPGLQPQEVDASTSKAEHTDDRLDDPATVHNVNPTTSGLLLVPPPNSHDVSATESVELREVLPVVSEDHHSSSSHAHETHVDV